MGCQVVFIGVRWSGWHFLEEKKSTLALITQLQILLGGSDTEELGRYPLIHKPFQRDFALFTFFRHLYLPSSLS